MADLLSVDPRDGAVVARHPIMDAAAVAAAIKACARAQTTWRKQGSEERAAVLREVAALLRRDADRHAALMTREMGKPITQALAEVEKCAWCCEFYAESAERMLAPERVASAASESWVSFQPLGVVLAVMPWNFPYWQAIRAAAPALMAGNGMVLKHASNVMGCALAIEATFRDALSSMGAPPDLFRSLIIGSAEVASVIDHPAISAVTLTGSTPAGQAVASRAGANLKPTVLELGGSDAYLVLADANLDLAVEACVTGRMFNGGQSCIAAKRWIVEAPLRAAFTERAVAAMEAYVPTDPSEPESLLGPMARVDLRDELHEQVLRAIAAGAKVLLGAELPDRPGAWYPPTVLDGVRPGNPAFDEELFGPIATITIAADEAEGIALANRSCFGLGAAVFTGDPARGRRIAEQELEAGSCFVNDFVRSDPRLPFGGIKASGYGRELGREGIRAFVNVKTVWVR